jgi:hypothetical protein
MLLPRVLITLTLQGLQIKSTSIHHRQSLHLMFCPIRRRNTTYNTLEIFILLQKRQPEEVYFPDFEMPQRLITKGCPTYATTKRLAPSY